MRVATPKPPHRGVLRLPDDFDAVYKCFGVCVAVGHTGDRWLFYRGGTYGRTRPSTHRDKPADFVGEIGLFFIPKIH